MGVGAGIGVGSRKILGGLDPKDFGVDWPRKILGGL